MKLLASASVCAGAFLWVSAVAPKRAEACGCFAPPDPSVPVVQSGERILFGVEDGVVTAHVQIQYSGDAEEFAWLVPLPAEPEMSLGTDELFNQLLQTTQPRYRVTREYLGNCLFEPGRGGGGPTSADTDSGGAGNPAPEDGGGSPLVVQDSVGPYDYAVLRADSKQPMLDWLQENRYFVPAGTDTAVDPYIREGAFFLALKLRKGESAGSLQPVVLKYRSALPMIPIVLTSVAADPDMPIIAWVLGEHRAIPRNYYHTVINDAAIDWLDFGSNYVDVVTRAVDEIEGHRSFVTEYAGTSTIMRDLLDYQGRYGDLDYLRTLTDAVAYVQYVMSNGFPTFSGQFGGPVLSSQLVGILERHLPVPQGLLDQGYQPVDYYGNIGYWVTTHRQQFPELYTDLDLDFDPAVMTDELKERIVDPTLDAGEMFRDFPYLTRLFTTMSPDEMTRDPVFSFNPDVPEVSNVHDARLQYLCSWYGSDDPATTPARLITEQGWVLSMPGGDDDYPWPDVDMPASRYTQVLREEGAPETVLDHDEAIDGVVDSSSGGCMVAGGGSGGMVLLGLALLYARRRRRG